MNLIILVYLLLLVTICTCPIPLHKEIQVTLFRLHKVLYGVTLSLKLYLSSIILFGFSSSYALYREDAVHVQYSCIMCICVLRCHMVSP